jgi:hypothetical protein
MQPRKKPGVDRTERASSAQGVRIARTCLAALALARYETFVRFRSRPANDSELPFITPRYAFRIRIAAIALQRKASCRRSPTQRSSRAKAAPGRCASQDFDKTIARIFGAAFGDIIRSAPSRF